MLLKANRQHTKRVCKVCKHHIIFTLKRRRKIIYYRLKKYTADDADFIKMERSKNDRKGYGAASCIYLGAWDTGKEKHNDGF